MLPTRVLPLMLLIWLAVALVECDSTPIVTLSHGGKLQGISTTFNNQPVNLFLGIRYAQPPIGNLRFRKPEALNPWQGIVNSTSPGELCAQSAMDGTLLGGEDCLFLDVTVPGHTEAGAKKPVMVWIHGGGYNSGTGSTYIGGPLATSGDVIVVSINYRLGIFGFLSDGPGTGNYGLWDQRAALVWVKDNIEQFGGDPDLVTIFGESAGASSVAAQTLGQHNDGLFKRAIQESGSAFLPWSWYLSLNDQQQIVADIKQKTNCASGNVYKCLRGLSTQAINNMVTITDPFNPPWKPVPDNDFFPESFEKTPTYELSKRFDLLAGMNGQEGAIQLVFDLGAFAAASNRSISDGVSLNLAKDYLKQKCSQLTPLSVGLCVEFLIKKYRIDRTRYNKDRAVRLSRFLELIAKEWLMNSFLNQTLKTYHQRLSEHMMRLWTNFAKSGNPNSPTKPAGYPEWPQFDEMSGRFMTLNSARPRVIDTPNKERLNELMNNLLVARDIQFKSDRVAKSCSTVTTLET